MSYIIIAACALIVLVTIILFFTGNMKKILEPKVFNSGEHNCVLRCEDIKFDRDNIDECFELSLIDDDEFLPYWSYVLVPNKCIKWVDKTNCERRIGAFRYVGKTNTDIEDYCVCEDLNKTTIPGVWNFILINCLKVHEKTIDDLTCDELNDVFINGNTCDEASKFFSSNACCASWRYKVFGDKCEGRFYEHNIEVLYLMLRKGCIDNEL